MASTVTYIPTTHCVLCLHVSGERVAATQSVHTYQACDLHAPLITEHGLADAIRRVKHNTTKGAV